MKIQSNTPKMHEVVQMFLELKAHFEDKLMLNTGGFQLLNYNQVQTVFAKLEYRRSVTCRPIQFAAYMLNPAKRGATLSLVE